MLKTIILIFACVLMGFFAVCAFIMAQAEKKERYKIKKQLDEVYEHEKDAAEIISNANKTKADARTGKHSTDIKFMADKLHDYAKK
nr:MAG TPA: hypothetical protein [Caudoviricetes sp.]